MSSTKSHWVGQYILNDAGEIVPERDLLKWAAWLQTTKHRQVAFNHIDNLVVSTIFLGLDQDALGVARGLSDSATYHPLIWETMIFYAHKVLYQERYRSREEAVKGHAEALQRARQIVSQRGTNQGEKTSEKCSVKGGAG